MSTADERRGALEAIERLINRGDDADRTLRGVVSALHDRVSDYSWVGISFVEGDALVLGPASGPAPGEPDLALPIRYEGRVVGELAVTAGGSGTLGPDDEAFLERVAILISAYTLVAWDTGGAAWEP